MTFSITIQNTECDLTALDVTVTTRQIFASDPCTLNVLPWKHLSLYPFYAEIRSLERVQIRKAVGLYILIIAEGENGGPKEERRDALYSLEQHVYENPLTANDVSS